jgi:hypothetical protein
MEHLQTIINTSGKEVAQKFNESLNQMTATLGMSEEDLNKFYEALNAVDWSNEDDWLAFPERLEELGLSIPEE